MGLLILPLCKGQRFMEAWGSGCHSEVWGVSGQVGRNKERKGEMGSAREPWLRRAGELCSFSNKDH